jgi:predicted dehydrogenase
MRVAIVGCGFVADYYVRTLAAHPELQLAGVTDRDPERLERFTRYYPLPRFESLDDLLERSGAEIVLNLTNPQSHFEVSQRSLSAGKHVYTEKPLAMCFDDAKRLVDLAETNHRLISSAPCSLLGETAQTIWKALRERQVGHVRLVYAEMNDGLVHRMQYKRWVSESGTAWPYKNEFEVGCTLEHAGYYVSWLAAFFGPAESVTAFSSCLIPDKDLAFMHDKASKAPSPRPSPEGRGSGTDFSVACIKFASGVVARLTCSIVSPHDHSLTIVGDEGVLSTKDCWFYQSPVYVRRMMTIRRKTFVSPWKRRYRLVKSGLESKFRYKGSQQMDFARGVSEMAAAINAGRTCRLSPQFSLHVLEVVLAIQNALENSSTYRLKSTFDPVEPMPWAT